MKLETLRKLALDALEDLKAVDIVTLDVSGLTDMTEEMILATGTSSRHVKSLANHLVEKLKQSGELPVGVEGDDVGEWVLVDMADILVHILLPEKRDFYDLESLWGSPIQMSSTGNKSQEQE